MRDPSLYTRLRLDPGQKVFYSIWRECIVVPAIIDEINEHVTLDDGRSGIINRYIDSSQDNFYLRTDTLDANGWNIFEIQKEVPPVKSVYNQLIWIDEPVGHAVLLGDEIFLTLQAALSGVSPSKKKNLKRRLQRERRRKMEYITLSRSKVGLETKWPKYPEKKIYVHRPR